MTHVLELVTSPDFCTHSDCRPETFLTAAQPQILIDDSLAGQLLIASPTIRDPRFDHAVILVVRHNHDGAMGIVINMPTDERPLANILEMVGEKDTNVTGKVQLFAGGPVQPELGLLIHSSDYRGPGTIDVNERVLMTSNSRILRISATTKGHRRVSLPSVMQVGRPISLTMNFDVAFGLPHQQM